MLSNGYWKYPKLIYTHLAYSIAVLLMMSASLNAQNNQIENLNYETEKAFSDDDVPSEQTLLEAPTTNKKMTPRQVPITYTVKKTEALIFVSVKLYGNPSMIKKIATWNNLEFPYVLRKDQVLILQKEPKNTTTKEKEDAVLKWLQEVTGQSNINDVNELLSNTVELWNIKGHMAKKKKTFRQTLKLIHKILLLDPTNYKAIELWSDLYFEKGELRKSLKTYEKLFQIYPSKTSIWKDAPGELDDIILTFTQEMAIRYYNAYVETKDDKLKDLAYRQAHRYLDLSYKHKYNLYNYHYYKNQLYLAKQNYHEAYFHIKQLVGNEQIAPGKEIQRIVTFFEGLNLLKMGRLDFAYYRFLKVIDENPNDGLAKSAKEIVDIVKKKSFYGIFSYSRAQGSNLSDTPNKKSLSPIGGTGYNQYLGTVGVRSLRKGNLLFDISSLGLLTDYTSSQDQNLSNLYYNVGLDFRPLASLFGSTFKFHYDFAILGLNEEVNNKYELKERIKTHNLSITNTYITGLCVLTLTLPYSYSIQKQSSEEVDQKSHSYGLDVKLDFWRRNKWWSPSLLLSVASERSSVDSQNQLDGQIKVSNSMSLENLSLSQSLSFSETKVNEDPANTQVLNAQTSISSPLSFISNKLSGRVTLSYDWRRDPTEDRPAQATSVIFGLTIGF